ncbi:hypothetical protein E5K02_14765 [Hymenobacter metallicola]|uniref:Lipoprotein n=1 Tax=Hymenobacter metallicola TaxID=2563114 RepID=A0A4Z0QC72_9BACT|nr:hypothetical protein E5K02_14765 [Hymenobacter metallicola]
MKLHPDCSFRISSVGLLGLLLFGGSACQTIQQLTRLPHRRIFTTFLAKADLIGITERQPVVAGNNTLFRYAYWYKKPRVPHGVYHLIIYLKVQNPEKLPLNRQLPFPDGNLGIIGYGSDMGGSFFSREVKDVRGSVTVLAATPTTYRLRWRVKYTGLYGTRTLNTTRTFTLDSTYFRR